MQSVDVLYWCGLAQMSLILKGLLPSIYHMWYVFLCFWGQSFHKNTFPVDIPMFYTFILDKTTPKSHFSQNIPLKECATLLPIVVFALQLGINWIKYIQILLGIVTSPPHHPPTIHPHVALQTTAMNACMIWLPVKAISALNKG